MVKAAASAAGAALSAAALTSAAVECISAKTYRRYEEGDFPYATPYAYYASDHRRRKVFFKSGKNTLAGYVYGLENPSPKAVLVFSHGIWALPDDYLVMLMWFADHGYRVFTFCNTGCGYSEGSSGRGLAQSALDLDAALSYLESSELAKDLPIVLLGHSWGGYAVSAVLCGHHPKVAASCSLSGFNSPMEVSMDVAESSYGFFGRLLRPFVYLSMKRRFGRRANISAAEAISYTDVPVLVIHGRGDAFIHYDRSAIIAHRDEIKNPKARFLTIGAQGRNGHNNYFGNAQASRYFQFLQKKYKRFQAQYHGHIPENVRKASIQSVNLRMLSQPNEVLMNRINDFYEEALS